MFSEFQRARHARGDPGYLVSVRFGAHDCIVRVLVEERH